MKVGGDRIPNFLKNICLLNIRPEKFSLRCPKHRGKRGVKAILTMSKQKHISLRVGFPNPLALHTYCPIYPRVFDDPLTQLNSQHCSHCLESLITHHIKYLLEFQIQESLNLSMCAESSTSTKKSEEEKRRRKK